MARTLVVGALLLLAAACGGRVGGTSAGNEGVGGTSRGSGGGDASGATGGGGTGGADSGSGGSGVGGQTNPPACPATAPVVGDACAGELQCSFVTMTKWCCDETAEATCSEGRWEVRYTECDCPGPCPDGLVECGGVCVDVTSDAANCGGCGIACSGGSTCTSCGLCFPRAPGICSQGMCTGSCAGGLTVCGSSCVDPCTSPLNCGECGSFCDVGFTCQAGECVCEAGHVQCGDACVDVERDPEHCGECGLVCEAGSACVDGVCQPPEWDACERNEDCRLAPASCCGACGAYTLDDVVAIDRDRLEQYRASVCPESGGCDACAWTELPSLGARCVDSRCEVVDPSVDDITACSTDADCTLATQACCECGAPTEYLAVNASRRAAYQALVCAEGQGCDDCVHDYPTELQATCSAGHCEISR